MPGGRSPSYQLMRIPKAMAIFARTRFVDVYGRNWVDTYIAYTYMPPGCSWECQELIKFSHCIRGFCQTDICLLVPRFELPAGVCWLRHQAVPMSEAGTAPLHSTRSEARSSSAVAQPLLAALDAALVRAAPAAAASLAWILLV